MDARLTRRGRLQAFVDFKPIGTRFIQRRQGLGGLTCTRIADMAIFGTRFGNEFVGHGVADKSSGNTHRAGGIENMNDRTGIDRLDTQRGVGLGRGRPADHQRHGHTRLLHFLGDRDHLVQRRRDKP